MFRFKQFSVKNEGAAFKVGTDAVLLGAALTLPSGNNLRILDAGTGTGIISLMVAQRLWGSNIIDFKLTAIDYDSDAVVEAAENFKESPWGNNLEIKKLSLLEFEKRMINAPKRFNLIISNPPYFENSLLNPDQKKRMARHTTENGLSWRTLMAFSEAFLAPGGRLAMILPVDSSPAATGSLELRRLIEIRTTPAKPVSRIIVEYEKPGLENSVPAESLIKEELTVLENGSYSRQYLSLTKDFHLFI